MLPQLINATLFSSFYLSSVFVKERDVKMNELFKYSFKFLISSLGFALKSALKFLFWLENILATREE